MAPHTQGPLRVAYRGDGSATILAEDGHGPVATVKLRKTYTHGSGEVKANADLFAAAPEMLAAMERALSVAEIAATADKRGLQKALEDIRNPLRAVIAKARGG